jgi:hypothetical protein
MERSSIMLRHFFTHHFYHLLQRLTLLFVLGLMSLPLILLQQDTLKHINLKLFGIEMQVTVTEKVEHIRRIFKPRVGWNEYSYWEISYSLLTAEYAQPVEERSETKQFFADMLLEQPGVSHVLDARTGTETNVTDNKNLAENIESGSKIKVTFIPGQDGFSELSENLQPLTYYIAGTLKVITLTILAMGAMLMLYTSSRQYAKNAPNTLNC